MNGFKFSRREKVILTIVGMLLLLRLIITLIIFRCDSFGALFKRSIRRGCDGYRLFLGWSKLPLGSESQVQRIIGEH